METGLMSDGRPSAGVLLSWSAKDDTHFIVIAVPFISDSVHRSKFDALFRRGKKDMKTMGCKEYAQAGKMIFGGRLEATGKPL
jgi:hypothetical protein